MMRNSACVLVIAGFVAAAGLARADSPQERGAYLMKSVVACGDCHTPRGPGGLGPELSGGFRFADDAFTAYSQNITPDPDTGIGDWTDAQIITAIREGRRPDGSMIGPPMPVGMYHGMSDDDVKALVAYLHTVKPVKNMVPKSAYRIPLPVSYGPPVATVPAVSDADPVKYGAYLAGPLAHCIECHTPLGPKGPDLAHNLGAGGNVFKGPWGVVASADITPAGLAKYTDAEIKTIITKGVRPDGTHIMGPMGIGAFSTMSDKDVTAIIAYLRSLPPK
jgi:mono/diheme cytochrome c family protein